MIRLPSDENVWDACSEPKPAPFIAMEEGRPNFVEDMLNMDFFKEEENHLEQMASGDALDIASASQRNMVTSPTSQRKKQKMALQTHQQMSTYPRPSQKKVVTFSTLREGTPTHPVETPPFNIKNQNWYNSHHNPPQHNDQHASAPVSSPPNPGEIAVIFPLLNIKATTSLYPSTKSTERPAIKKEKMDAEANSPSINYYFDPRSQPYYYPSKYQPTEVRPAVEQIPEDYCEDAPNNRFQLLEQPSSRQRKSYKNENRYIVPNPLTICAKPHVTPSQILRGVVTVKLVDKEGGTIASDRGNILESVDGSLSQPLYGPNLSTDFSLKVLQTSQGNMFRLLFVVNYVMEGIGTCEEKIFSRPFVVHSNRRKNSKEKPIIFEVKPFEGAASSPTEVVIKGIGFNDRVAVQFGVQPAHIIAVTDNYIKVVPPPIDTETDKTVKVTVSNLYPQNELRTAEKNLYFTYRAIKYERMDADDIPNGIPWPQEYVREM